MDPNILLEHSLESERICPFHCSNFGLQTQTHCKIALPDLSEDPRPTSQISRHLLVGGLLSPEANRRHRQLKDSLKYTRGGKPTNHHISWECPIFKDFRAQAALSRPIEEFPMYFHITLVPENEKTPRITCTKSRFPWPTFGNVTCKIGKMHMHHPHLTGQHLLQQKLQTAAQHKQKTGTLYNYFLKELVFFLRDVWNLDNNYDVHPSQSFFKHLQVQKPAGRSMVDQTRSTSRTQPTRS